MIHLSATTLRIATYAARVDAARRSGRSIFDSALGPPPPRETCRRCGSDRETYRRHVIVKGYRVLRLRCRACDRLDHRKGA